MPRCCRDGLPPAIEEGRHVSITGTGSPQSPYIISATTSLDVEPNELFRLILTGDGTLEAPWRLEVRYAESASLNDLPDVAVNGVSNGQVLAWNASTQMWEAAPPAVAPPGLVNTGNGIGGDGSAGSPLVAVPNLERYLEVTSAGIGLSNAGLNALVRRFDTAAARATATPAPTLGTLSILATNPDQIEAWDGAEWVPVTGGHRKDIQPGEFLALSGPYSGGMTTTYVAQLDITTDASGAFVAIPDVDLTEYAGVLAVSVQETGLTPWKAVLQAGVDDIVGVAYRLDTGLPYPTASLTGTVWATLY